MSLRTSTLTLAASIAFAAAAFSPVAAQAQSHSDGFQAVGDSLVFVGHPSPSTTTRAQVQAELAAWNKSAVLADGFQSRGDSFVFVGHAQASTKTRAEVQAELAVWRKNPVHHDGWAEVGGDALRFVGRPAPADVQMAAATR